MDATTQQQQYAGTFHGLHRTGDPLVLFNAWDVATTEVIAKTSPAVATSSAAVASALGYDDGESVPLEMVAGLVSRMTAAVSVPVSIDLEAGYGDTVRRVSLRPWPMMAAMRVIEEAAATVAASKQYGRFLQPKA